MNYIFHSFKRLAAKEFIGKWNFVGLAQSGIVIQKDGKGFRFGTIRSRSFTSPMFLQPSSATQNEAMSSAALASSAAITFFMKLV